MASKPTKGTVVSFGNTPQAKDDNFVGLGTEDSNGVIYLDVMGNDLGGKGKSLWSIDDAVSEGGARPADLLAEDAVGVQETSKLGAKIWITQDGKVAYQLTDELRSLYQSLATGQTVVDTFTYAIQMGNGTLSWAQASFTIAGTNDKPVVQGVSIAVVEDGPAVTGGFIGDDVDADDDGASIQYNLLTVPGTGTLTNNGNGTFTYDTEGKFQELAVGETATLNFKYTATDKHGAVSDPATGTITVTGVNDAPTLSAGAVSAVEDGGPVTLDLAALGDDIDSDNDGSDLVYSLVGALPGDDRKDLPGAGHATISGTTLSYDPGSDFQGLAQGETATLTLDVMATDKHGAATTNTVVVTITGTNDAPTLADGGSISVVEDGPAATLDLSTLADDIDSDDDAGSLTYAFKGQPAQGTVSLNGSMLSFDPGTQYQQLAEGQTVFVDLTAFATDSHTASAVNTVRLTVTGTNDEVVVLGSKNGFVDAVPAANAAPDQLHSATGAITFTDIDFADKHSVSLTIPFLTLGTFSASVVNDSTGGGLGVVTWNYVVDNDTIAYLGAGESVTNTYFVNISDGKGSTAQQQVDVVVNGVNDAPVITSGADQAKGIVKEDGVLTASARVTISDLDNSDTHTWSIASNTSGVYGTAVVDGTGQWTYTLANDSSAVQDLHESETIVETFTVRASDGKGGIVDQVVNVVVTGTNDAPTLASGGSISVVENGAASTLDLATLAGDVDNDDDAGSLQYKLLTQPAQGTASITGTTLSFDPGTGYQELNAGMPAFVLVDVEARDKHDATTVTQVKLNVMGVNDAPTLKALTLAATEDGGAVTTNLALLGDDVDFENDGSNLLYEIVSQPPAGHGQAAIIGTGPSTSLSFMPGADFQELRLGQAEAVQVQVKATDFRGASVVQTFTVKVVGQNDIPMLASGGTMTATEDGPAVSFNLAAIGNDVDNDDDGTTLSYSLLPPIPTQGTATIDNITDTLDYAIGSAFQSLGQGEVKAFDLLVRATDSHGAYNQTTVKVNVVGTNDAPVFGAGDATGAVTALSGTQTLKLEQWTNYFGSLQENDLRNFAANNAATYTVNTGIIDYTDDPGGFSGEIPGSMRWPADPTGASGTGGINNHFFARVTGQISVSANDTYTFRTFSDDGVYLRVNDALIINDPNTHAEEVRTGDITLAPGVYPVELFFFEYDGEASLEFTYKNSTGVYGHVVSTQQVGDSGVLNFSDVDQIDTHTVSVVPVGSNLGALSAVLTNDTTGTGAGGQVAWNYAVDSEAVEFLGAGQTKVESFKVTVSDLKGGTAQQQVNVTITGINDGPTAVSDTISVNEDQPVAINVLGNDTDPDQGDTLSLVAATGAANGTLELVGNLVKYTPYANFSGTDTFSYTVKDAAGLTSMANVSVTVAPMNDAPKIVAAATPLAIKNGSFESISTGVTVNTGSTVLNGWTVPNDWTLTGAGIDVVSDWQAADGSRVIDVNAFNRGGVLQTLSTRAGETYTIGFSLSQNPGVSGTSTLRVAAGSATQDYSYDAPNTKANMLWTNQSFTFTATGDSTVLSFSSLTPATNQGPIGNAEGPAIDNVRVISSLAALENSSTLIRNLSVSDIDAGTDAIRIDLSVGKGELALVNTAGLTVIDANGSDGSIAYMGSQASINTALAAGVQYKPIGGFFGNDTLLATVNDLGNTGAPGAQAASVSQQISVVAVGAVPISNWTANGNSLDVIAPANNGTVVGDVSYAPGRNGGQAFSFDGSGGDYVSVVREIQNDFTIAGWMKSSAASLSGGQFFHGNGLVYADVGGLHNDFGVSVLNGKLAFGTGAPDTTIQSATSVTNDTWVQFAAVREGSTISLWINGVLEAQVDTGNGGALADPATITFGGNVVDGRYFTGLLDDVAFFDHALTQVEIVGLANSNPV